MRLDYHARAEIEARYQARRAGGHAGWKDTYDWSLQQLEQAVSRYRPGRQALLELGCGAGNIALAAATAGLFDRVYGVDLSGAAIAWARARAAEAGVAADFGVGNVVDLAAYEEGLFDLVFDSDCLHMIVGDDRAECLASVRRVLRPGGLFCVSTQCRDPGITERYVHSDTAYFDPGTALLMRDGLPYYYLGLPHEVLAELAAAGFEVLDWRLRPKDDRDDPYVAGRLLANAAKPAG